MLTAQTGILQPGRPQALRCGSSSHAIRHALPFSAHPCGSSGAQLNIFPNMRSGLTISQNAQSRDSGDGAESSRDPSTSSLNVPSTSGRSPQPGGRQSSSVGGSDGGTPQQRPPNLLQRLAFSIAGLWAALPAWLRSPFKYLTPRVIRAAALFALGITVSVMAHTGSRRATTGGAAAGPQEVVYSEFLRLVDSGNVGAARFEDGTGRILFDLRPHSSEQAAALAADAVQQDQQQGASSSAAAADQLADEAVSTATVTFKGRSRTPRQFYTRHIPDPQLIARLMAASVEFGSVRASMSAAVVRAMTTMLALWLPLIPMFILMRRFLEGRNGAKKRKGGTPEKGVPPTTFADVAGVGPAKQELLEVVACLRDSRRFARLGARMPSGVLLCGPPGTGKTLLARAVAGEAGVPFIAVSASEFVEMFVGRGAARVRELFAEARKQAPCVIFIDELDAVGGKRGAGLNEERDQTLNQLLTELDGFEGRPGVLLLAATNRPEVLDAALLRPGRLSRRVNVPLPDEPGRAAISSVHLRKVPLEGGQEGNEAAAALVARLSAGFSGAELSNVVNEAAFLAARRGGDTVALGDLVDAISRTRYGVGGGPPAGPLARRLRDWIIDSAGSGKQVRTQPMGS